MNQATTKRTMLLAGLVVCAASGAGFSQTPIHTIDTDGVESGTAARSASVVGDVDQDGVQDFALRGYWTSISFSEDLLVYSGATGALLHRLPLSGLLSDLYVQEVQPAGDLNGDGYDDILIGSQHYSPPQPQLGTNWGRIYVLSGLDLSVLLQVTGEASQEHLGLALCRAGDLDQDGVEDYAASGLTFGPGMNGGFVQVFSGATGLVIQEWASPTRESYGSVIACLGDVDQDGFPDMLIGSDTFPSFGHSSDGAAWAMSGRTGALLYQVSGSPNTSNGVDRFATDVAAIGDIDGDGAADFVVSAPADLDLGPGSLWVFSGATGSVIHRVPGEDVFIGPGGPLAMWFVSSAGDVNGDGVPDFMASHPGGTDINQQFTPGIVRVFSGADGQKLMQLDGRREGDEQFGKSISALDDVNGDGYGDFVVAIQDRVTGEFSDSFPNFGLNGAVVIYSGTCLGPVSYCSASPNSSGAGASLTSTGSLSLAANNSVLHVTGAPPNKFGLFFYGGGAVTMPLGDGRLCVGPGSAGLFRLQPILQTDGAGAANFAIDFSGPLMGSGPGEVLATSSWNFQFWFRDPGGAGGGFNLSNALEAYICP